MRKLQPAAGAPIGIFDSGVGGLTVVKEIVRLLPGEHFVYLGDTARTPYGSKAKETVQRFTLEAVAHLLQHRIKALVVACNTASACALPILRRRLKIPVLGVIQPGARAAVQHAQQRPVGVVGTKATIKSQAYVKALRASHCPNPILTQPCPLLVPLVEEGWLRHPITRQVLRVYLAPLLESGIKSLILGCTHYPALKPLIADICGPRVRLIDSAEEVAQELHGTLESLDLLRGGSRTGRRTFLVTDVPEQFQRVGRLLLGGPLTGVRRVNISGSQSHV